jgi:alpha-L-fucosidase 2
MESMNMRWFLALLAVLVTTSSTFAGDQMLWYTKPADVVRDPLNTVAKPSSWMNVALPIGNGKLGGLVAGGTAHEEVVLNDISLWTGDDNPSGNYDSMGAYQTLAKLVIDQPGVTNPTDYRRDLDISDAVAHVTYTAGGVKFSRAYFCSHPDNVLVIRLTADKPGAYTGTIRLADGHSAKTVVNDRRLMAAGALPNGLKYETQVAAESDGGTVKAAGNQVEFTGCNAVTLVVAAGTDYSMSFGNHYRGDDPHSAVSAAPFLATLNGFDRLLANHLADYHSLFDRVSLDLGQSTDEQRALPTDERKRKAADTFDPEMESLLFQYGRYLLISSSRPGSLPANLQGLWNDENNPPWHCDYHANINVQMNYWPAEPANLSECAVPFFDLVDSQLPAWRDATSKSPEFKTADGEFPKRGFAIRTSHNISGGMGWNWDKTANAWYCLHFWEHYAFTGDKDFLRTTAYPIMKETCQFWEDHLKTEPDGRLVVPRAWSPEHGPVQDGVSYSQEIVWDLFNNYVAAADVLGIDREYRDKVATMCDKLATPGVGSWGQLLEWMHELHDPKSPELDTPNDHHRHTSHLFAVYPGHQIDLTSTPALAAAAKVSLDARGDTGDVREWSFAWRTALFARLGDGESAHRQLQHLLADRNSCPNLFGQHPPMQIDGNFGITAAVCEMLLQSQNGTLKLLPALPKAWSTGKVTGLCARGGFVVDLEWKDGKLTAATILSKEGSPPRISYAGKITELKLDRGARIAWTPGK